MISADQPAFPETHIYHFKGKDADGEHDNVVPRWMGGLTKREYMATSLMRGLLSDAQHTAAMTNGGQKVAEGAAKMACLFADALIKELSK